MLSARQALRTSTLLSGARGQERMCATLSDRAYYCLEGDERARKGGLMVTRSVAQAVQFV